MAKTEKTKEQIIENFKKYYRVQMSGLYNMIAEWKGAAEMAGLSDDDCWDVIENYKEYKQIYEEATKAYYRRA